MWNTLKSLSYDFIIFLWLHMYTLPTYVYGYIRPAFPGRLWGHRLGRNWPYRLQFAGAGTGDFKFELFPV